MKLKDGQIITLDDNNKYMVVSAIDYKDKSYVYLIHCEDNSIVRFCTQEDDNGTIKIIDTDDESLNRKLLLLFTKQIHENLTNDGLLG